MTKEQFTWMAPRAKWIILGFSATLMTLCMFWWFFVWISSIETGIPTINIPAIWTYIGFLLVPSWVLLPGNIYESDKFFDTFISKEKQCG